MALVYKMKLNYEAVTPRAREVQIISLVSLR
jgi:hypothetical protein